MYMAVDAPLQSADIMDLARLVHPTVIRHDFLKPGFFYLRFEHVIDSTELRRVMVALKDSLSSIQSDRSLCYLSLGRFNQQDTTRFHLDGAPEESYLMLGYEPSAIQSELTIADYAKLAHQLGITPKQFLNDFNPMFDNNEQRLTPFVTQIQEFDYRHSGILLVNNSSLPYDPNKKHSQGVMHKATIHQTDMNLNRIVNSTMIGVGTEKIDSREIQQFQQTSEVAGIIADSN